MLNNVSCEIPAEEIANDYGIEVPQQVLMVLKNKKKEFFEKNKIADSKTGKGEAGTTTSSYYSSGTTYITNVSPYVTKPAMVKLNLEKAKIKLTYSKQSGK